MKTTLLVLICLVLSWHLSAGVSASAENPDIKQQAETLLDQSFKQDHDLAIQTAQQALALFQSINDQEGIGDTYLALGRFYLALNKMNESAQSSELSLHIWQQLQNPANQVRALIQLGYIEGRRGEWVNGFSYLTQAQNLLDDDRENLESLARIASGMGYVFNESGLPQYGLTQYQRAREYFRQTSHARGFNRQTMMVGYTHFLQENYPAALSDLQDALERFKSSGDENAGDDIAECEEYVGQVYLATGQYDLALKSLLPIPPYWEDKGHNGDAAQVKALLGTVYQREGKIELARSNYEAALKNFREDAAPVKKAAVAFALGRLELSEGNYDTAENYLKESIETTEDIRSDLSSRMLATAFSASVHDRYETYIECLMRKDQQHRSQSLEQQAFQASELARARTLAALLRDRQTKIVTGIDPRLAERERTLRQTIRAKAEETISLLATDYKKEQLDELEQSLRRLREQHQQLTLQLQIQNPHYDQIKETTNYSVQQIQDLIVEDNETMLLEYFLGKNASYVWAFTRNDARVYELPKADVITGEVKTLYELLAKKPDDDTETRLNKAGGELAQMILTPLANQSTIKRVIVVADGALNYIPFQLLPGPSGDPLVASYEIVNAPSASVLGQLRSEKQQRPAGNKILMAFGYPVFRSNYAQFKNSETGDVVASTERGLEVDADSLDPDKIQPLVYSKYELDYLQEIAGSSAFIARGFDASRAVLERTDFSRYSILHFATHGLLDPKNPKKLGFYLSMVDENGKDQEGFITMQDVYNLRVPVSLVVLSACRTGLGEDVRGEGLIGLTRGFMHAGASSVVASLWKVDDEATAELMKYFYTNMLKKGMRPAAALREAQTTLRHNPQWQSPHYWAGFILQGEFKEPIKLPKPTTAPSTVQNAVGLALLFTLLAGIGWGYWRRRRV
ncbi:MAG TPA: CHAT domain-containing protein [Pyrinomonadaceae bacterium]|jgi:CHAT domain-containing protein|nr:CHAT domain-containing protein [Pyrinomonadaceae bacterium]